ncbi:MAG: type III-B CRISPR module RAMP protein Cmr4 [Deltaproteobacteria bacterium]|nr:type III-B CRISPR module RAMP protein Cmr4 [Deltaproteobacteria bacterium]
MFESKAALFLYCVSPVHMGAGTALGAIDNPIQRERHTGHPCMAGSGIKGAMRHVAETLWDKGTVKKVFGPETQASEHAGALSLSDAQIVLFPVRSLRRSYVYATCPTALARLQRLLTFAGQAQKWSIPNVSGEGCDLANDELKTNGSLVLEAYEFKPSGDGQNLKTIAGWIATNALPNDEAHCYFREKIKSDIVLLADEKFSYFVRNATAVEPHVRINDDSGTADGGGLFYTENLPPEALLVSLAMASKDRENGDLDAEKVLSTVKTGNDSGNGFDGRLLQVGGDSTTGRGQVMLKFVAGEADNA